MSTNGTQPPAAAGQDPVADPQALAEAIRSGEAKAFFYVPEPAYERGFVADPAVHDVVGLIDCEATDKIAETAHPVEIGIVKVAVERASGRIAAYVDELNMLEEPAVPCTPQAQRVHGLSPEMLCGKRFDDEAIARFVADVDYLCAHNADYDRPVISRRLPALGDKPWACSFREVAWDQRGCSSRALDYLLFKAGKVHRAHRAAADCVALAAVLAHAYEGPEGSMRPGFVELAESVRSVHYHVLAVGSDFDSKAKLQERRYFWCDGSGAERKFPVKAWASQPLKGGDALRDEVAWLAANAYKQRDLPRAHVAIAPIPAQLRYSLDAQRVSIERDGFAVQFSEFLADPQSFFRSEAPMGEEQSSAGRERRGEHSSTL